MVSNIAIAIMCVIVLAAGIFAWWMENGGSSEEPETDEDKKET